MGKWPLTILSSILDTSSNAFYVLGGQMDRLGVPAVLGSRYSESTVLLAGSFLHERLNHLIEVALIYAAQKDIQPPIDSGYIRDRAGYHTKSAFFYAGS
jgi:hypothetical protein